jgi:hypothetical protein
MAAAAVRVQCNAGMAAFGDGIGDDGALRHHACSAHAWPACASPVHAEHRASALERASTPAAAAADTLTPEELAFFRRWGYLIKRRAVDAATCARLVDRMWATAPPSLDRQDPRSWRAFEAPEASDDPLLLKQGTRWQWRAASTEAELLAVVWNARITGWAEQLLGTGTLRPPREGGRPMGSWGTVWPGGPVDPQLGEGVRGIYATLPSPPGTVVSDRLHTDGHPFHLGVVCLLEDNPPNGGAFKVWPGSHRRFYPLFPMQYDQARIPFYDHLPSHKGILHPPDYLAEVARVEADTPPVDCFGEAGDIVLWHHRLGHMAGINTAAPPVIRQALLADFCKADLDATRCDPPQADMWRDWSLALRTVDVPISAQFAAEQRLPLALLTAAAAGAG